MPLAKIRLLHIYVYILRYPKWVNNYVTMFMMTTL